MNDADPPFSERAPEAWTFHRHSSRWAFNTLTPGTDDTPEPGRELAGARFLALPAPEPVDVGLCDAIGRRCSARAFAADPLGLEALSALLHWTAGSLGPVRLGAMEMLRRPAPSAGGMYALEYYVIARNVAGIEPAIYHYQPVGHGLEEVRDAVPPRALSDYLFMGQPYVTQAAAAIVVTAMFGRSLKKYRDRGYRYLLIETGHAAQNLMLCAAGLGLGTCGIGGFFDVELAQLLRLDVARELPLYAIACGPAQADPEDAGPGA